MEIPEGTGSQKPKLLNESIRGGGWAGSTREKPKERYGNFLEQHICKKNKVDKKAVLSKLKHKFGKGVQDYNDQNGL